MITLYRFGSFFGLPDASPFCFKTMVLLKIAGLEFKSDFTGMRKAPKGKMPYIVDDGKTITDSTLIRFHIEEKYGFDFEAGLSDEQKGIAWAVEKMLEDHVYWVLLNDRWCNIENFNIGARKFFDVAPAPIRSFIANMVRKKIVKASKAHGMGRHSDAEVHEFGRHAIASVASVLGDKPYLMGDKICGADATAFAFLESLGAKGFDTPMIDEVDAHENLRAYLDRMRKQWFPDIKARA